MKASCALDHEVTDQLLADLRKDPFAGLGWQFDGVEFPLRFAPGEYLRATRTSDGVCLGVALIVRSLPGCCEVHSFLGELARPHMKEICKMVVRHAFSVPSTERVTAYCPSDIPAAARRAASIGFKHEGTIRNMAKRNGKLLDFHVYGILRKEFEEWQQQ